MLDKAYDPKAVEDQIYKMWEESGAFKADSNSTKESFTISMPPPNATGQLHLGHAVMLALEDIFIRFARMNGKEALWVPGTDHAAIATENVVIKLLKEQGMKDPRKELGREKLIEKIAEFVEQSKTTIRSQVRKMGSSCDWSRERYTFEPSLNRMVNEVFKKMYDDGLIYRGHRIVNWDPKLQTTVSDDEVVYIEEKAPFYTFQYGPFQIATSRPETKFGDKYVVMHPADERYKQYKHGDTFDAEWINGPVRATVIKDEAVDPAFGTGVMTITPWHDTADFEIAERHGLEKEQVIDYTGKLLPIAEEFAGMKIEDARPLIVEKLKSKGLVTKEDPNYVHNKATNQRGGGTIEPQIKLQWFIDVNKPVVDWKGKKMSLKEVMHDVVHYGDIEIIPERFGKTYFHWIDNLRDWCISRQIYWGHRIPVWYRGDEVYCGAKAPEGEGWAQDEDTLDTWFSSGLWTWSTLIDPKLTEDFSLSIEDILKQSPDFQKFHPTSVMETGYDILFFWVARMVLMTTYATGQIPFKTVYLHGLIRTRDGKKMSKSDPSTMIDPLDIISNYGADALRLSMIVGQSPGADSRLYEEKIAGYRNFINKLWNASRFVLMQCEAAGVSPSGIENGELKIENLSLADKALIFELDNIISLVEEGLKAYRLSEAGTFLYTFVWEFFCDWYLELSKGNANAEVLVHALRVILKILHPYCPFVTEEIWTSIKPKNTDSLIKQAWPMQSGLDFHVERQSLQIMIDLITEIRSLRSRADEYQASSLSPSDIADIVIVNDSYSEFYKEHQSQIQKISRSSITFDDNHPEAGTQELAGNGEIERLQTSCIPGFLPNGTEIYLDISDSFDADAVHDKLQKEKENLVRYIAGIEAKLGNEQFISKAPAALVDEQKAKLAEAKGKLEKIEERLKTL